jgi:hypothetical protein
MTEDEIRKLAQMKFANGTLQRQYAVAARKGASAAEPALSVGSAFLDPCVVCGERSTQLRYELHSVAFHHRCHRIWEEEREKLTPRG